MQGSQLAGQKEAPQAHNSIFLLVFARRSSNVAQFRWEGIRFRLSLSSLGSLWLGILATRAPWSPARHMRFACPLYLFVCNYACSKQNPGALDNVTRPHCTPLPTVHFLYLPFPISQFPISHWQRVMLFSMLRHVANADATTMDSLDSFALERQHKSHRRSRL